MSSQNTSTDAIERSEVLRVSNADQERFVEALLSPPRPAPALQRAFARHRKLIVE